MTFPIPSTIRPATAEALKRRMQLLGIEEKDLEERFMRSSGPGGQHVNKTSTAVRIKHLPTGIEVRHEAHRSQAMNRFFARRLLCEKLAQARGEMTAADRKIAKAKKQKARRQRRSRSVSRPVDKEAESTIEKETNLSAVAADAKRVSRTK